VRSLISPGAWKQPWLALPLAVLTCGIATGVGLATSLEGRPGSSALFVLAVVISTYAGGVLAGVLASVLSYLALDYFFLQPVHSLRIAESNIAPLCVFLVTVAVIAGLLHREQRAGERLRQLADAEREARARSEFLEALAGKLGTTTTSTAVAEAAISMLRTARIPMAAVCVLHERTIDVLAVGGVGEFDSDLYPEYVCGRPSTPVASAAATGQSVELRNGAELDLRDPDGAVLRRQLRLESSAALPLCGSEAQITGVLVVSSPAADWPDERTRDLLVQVAEQCGPLSSGCVCSKWSTTLHSVCSGLSFPEDGRPGRVAIRGYYEGRKPISSKLGRLVRQLPPSVAVSGSAWATSSARHRGGRDHGAAANRTPRRLARTAPTLDSCCLGWTDTQAAGDSWNADGLLHGARPGDGSNPLHARDIRPLAVSPSGEASWVEEDDPGHCWVSRAGLARTPKRCSTRSPS
jgi:hypothetical protein